MKKGLLFLMLLAFSCLTYGQLFKKDSTAFTKEYRKAGTPKRVGMITLITGSTLALAGGVMYLSEYGNGLPGGTGYNDGVATTGEVLFYTGMGLVVASAVLFETNKKQRSISKGVPAQPFVEMGTALQPRATGMARCRYPCLGIQVRW